MHRSLRFRRARVQLQERFFQEGLRTFQQTLVTPIHGLGGCAVECLGRVCHGFVEPGLNPGLKFAAHFSEKLLAAVELAFQVRGLLRKPLR